MQTNQTIYVIPSESQNTESRVENALETIQHIQKHGLAGKENLIWICLGSLYGSSTEHKKRRVNSVMEDILSIWQHVATGDPVRQENLIRVCLEDLCLDGTMDREIETSFSN